MEIYKILKLTVWRGDYFYKSWTYTEVGITDNIELVERLKSVKVGEEEGWPACQMKGWHMYKIHKVDLINEWNDDRLIDLDQSSDVDE
jgi:hypothetical protein